ncbi:MAG: caspase family protein [Lewinellaceae bacterium]|nr:caspase family protein [Lewinellaceae bacterium]
MPKNPNNATRNEGFEWNSGPLSGGGRSWFLGIGINKYLHFSPLNNAVKDVQDLIALLIERYQFKKEYATLLFDEEATQANIITVLDGYVEQLQPDDNLLLFYSGHGHLNQRTGRGFWIPVDARPGQAARYISNSLIKNYIEDIPTRHTLLISDSCFSGSLFVRGATRSSLAIDELEQRRSRWALCSGRHDELVNDGNPGENSPFTSSILKVLSQNQAPKLNILKIVDEVMELTRAIYRQLPEGNPLFDAGHEGGQFVFHRKKAIETTASVAAPILPETVDPLKQPQPEKPPSIQQTGEGAFFKKNLFPVILILLLTFLVWGFLHFLASSEHEAKVASDNTINGLENQLVISRDTNENTSQETSIPETGKGDPASAPKENNEQESPPEKLPAPIPEAAIRQVRLLVPSAWKNGKVMIDGQQAREVRRVGVYIILDIGYGSHEIKLVSGERDCTRIVQVDAESKEIAFVCN